MRPASVSNLDLVLDINTDAWLLNKRDDFNGPIVDFHYDLMTECRFAWRVMHVLQNIHIRYRRIPSLASFEVREIPSYCGDDLYVYPKIFWWGLNSEKLLLNWRQKSSVKTIFHYDLPEKLERRASSNHKDIFNPFLLLSCL